MTGQYKKWEIWLAKVKFEDCDTVVNRPVIITGIGEAAILAVKVTKHEPRRSYIGEYRITCWHEAGLRMPSTARLSKRLHLCESDMVHKIGRLHPSDILRIQQMIQNLI
mgnify:CR=1 FL=1